MIETNGSKAAPVCSRSRRRERAHWAKASAPITSKRPRPSTIPIRNVHCKSHPAVDKSRKATVSVRVKILSLGGKGGIT